MVHVWVVFGLQVPEMHLIEEQFPASDAYSQAISLLLREIRVRFLDQNFDFFHVVRWFRISIQICNPFGFSFGHGFWFRFQLCDLRFELRFEIWDLRFDFCLLLVLDIYFDLNLGFAIWFSQFGRLTQIFLS